MSNTENSMPETLDDARQAIENEAVEQAEVVESRDGAAEAREVANDDATFRMDDLTPDMLAEMYGIDEASQQVGEMFGETSDEPAVRAEEDDTPEGTTEEEETASEESAEADDEEQSEEVEPENEPEKFIVDLKDAEDQGLVLSMKVDGEFREFNMQEIQKYVGQSEVAEEKSRRAAEERATADKAIAELHSERERLQVESQIRQADQQLASMASQVQDLSTRIDAAKAEGNRYEAQELRDQQNDLMTEYRALYDGAQKRVKQQEANWLAAQREKLAQSETGKKFVEDAGYRSEIAQVLSERNLNPQALKAIQMDADLAALVIELHELKQNVTPKKRTQKPLSKVLRPSATSKKPVPKQANLKDKLDGGATTLADLRDNPGLLGDF